ncbi:class I SAM-dependent methyltransferase [Pelagibacteraceae bacterium]|nr:class I SAM-dependent methyltransferase [Pelagibacteraceae bacterium]
MDSNINKISNFFDSYAEGFSSIYNEDDKKRSLFNKIIDKLFRKAVYLRYKETIKKTSNDTIETVLDVGCGPGHYVLTFLEQGKKVVALDVAQQMLDLTEKRVKDKNLDANLELKLGDFLEINFDKKFDAIVLMGFFDYVEDPVKVLKKLIKECNKQIYISIPGTFGIFGLQRRFRYWLKNCPLYLYSYERLIDILKQANCLEKTDIKKIEKGYYITINV